jgi:hypothetical protein
MADQHEWVESYVGALPAELRPTDITENIKKHLRIAYKNGWKPIDLARAVSAGNYTNANNPLGASIYRLEKLAEQKAPPKVSNNFPVFNSEKRREPKPKEWIAERVALLTAIGNGLATTPEEAERMMLELTRKQQESDN